MSANTNFQNAMTAAIGFDEPWYQSIGMHTDEAINAIRNCWFCTQMLTEQKPPDTAFESNVILALRIKDLKHCGPFSIGRGNPAAGFRKFDSQVAAAGNATHITFELLRRNNHDWKNVLDTFIIEGVQRYQVEYGGLGSHRGFYTFVFPEICKTVLARSIMELWARPVLERELKTYSKKWIENRFAPGGVGYFKTATHFELQAALQHG